LSMISKALLFKGIRACGIRVA
ncbi:unnamed protein product, partial [Didymodactylos carnosus]